MRSATSQSSDAESEDRVSSERLHPSPSPAPGSSDSEDRIPLSQRAAVRAGARTRLVTAGRAPVRRHRASTSASRGVGAGSPEGVASTIKGPDLAAIRARYQVPREVGLFLPTPDDRVTSSRPGRVAVYEISLKFGLRLPFHPFFVNLLDLYSLTPAQLVPNSLRIICAFMVLCSHLQITPQLSLFRCFYTLRQQRGWCLFHPRPDRALKLALPSSVKGWKSRFFFADLEAVKSHWGSPDLRPNSNSAVLARDQEAYGQLLTSDIPRYNILLSEANLRQAGLLPQAGAMRPPPASVREAIAKRARARSGPISGEQADAPKRLRIGGSDPPAPPVPPTWEAEPAAAPGPPAPDVDLTADTPPDRAETVERALDELVAAISATGEPPRQSEPAPTVVEGPSGTKPSPNPVRASSPPRTDPEPEGGAERSTAEPTPCGFSLLNDGRRAERLMSVVIRPDFQEELRTLGANKFFRDAYAAMVRVVNSLALTREALGEGEAAANQLQQDAEDALAEAREARARAETAEKALESAQADLARKLEEANCRVEVADKRLHEALDQISEAESAIEARNLHIADLNSDLQAAEDRAKRVGEEVEGAKKAEEVAVSLLAAEREARALAEAKATGAVEEYKASADFIRELSEANADYYLQGFDEAKKKIARVLNLPQALGIRPCDDADDGEHPADP